jgi:hypothetical protein
MFSRPKKLLSFIFLIGIFLLLGSEVLAAVDTGINEVGDSIGLSSKSPLQIATDIINVLMGLMAIGAVSLILWGGFTWMSSNGSEDKIDKAKKILRNGVIGLVIILSSWGIAYFVLSKIISSTGNSNGGSDGCTNGASTSCGCGGAQTCNNGSWGPCLGSTCDPIIDNQTSCDGKAAVAECQADNDLCGLDYICNESTCLCESKASLGESCNANANGGTCQADDNLCGPYLKCDPDSCVCTGPPVITGMSPVGGFCVNDQERGCNQDADCLGGAKCDLTTPNGAGNNFITIYGYNFGGASNLFENSLTNIDFESGVIGSVPNDWSAANQKRSKVGITNKDFKSGSKSVVIHQDSNLNWPGTCSKEICEDLACVWSDANKTCTFSSGDQSHSAPAVYNQGESLVWGNSNNVMWTKLTYNLAPLNFKLGDTYSVQFYYKGVSSAAVNIQIGYDLGWTTQCVGYDYYSALKSGYSWDGSKVVPTPPAGEDPCNSSWLGGTCSEQSNVCCAQAPYQKQCYNALTMTAIPAGTIDDWTLYSYTFQYTPDMEKWLDKNGNKKMEIGLSIGYNSTGNKGTDFYIDDFTVTKVLNTGKVTFLGQSESQSQLANFPKLLNPSCIGNWTDRQVTIAIPSGAVSGPIQIKREGNDDNSVDITNDDKGPKIADFVKNNISRPSLCQISPEQGSLGSKVGYQGINLKNSVAYFGKYSSAYKGINSTFAIDNLSGQTLAPAIVAGQTTTFVEKATTGVSQKSNALVFIKQKEVEGGPYISSFYPASGPAGQYLTILGSGFGNLRGSRKVLLGDKEASYEFPEVCLNSVWRDDQIIVKIPDGLATGNYEIKVDLGNNNIINTDLLSPDNTFKINPLESLKTSLCKIDPERGQVGDTVSLWGEYFGTAGTNALVEFNRGINVSAKITKDSLADKIETMVPISDSGVSAITGPVKVLKNGESGNELNFTVGKCVSNEECNASSPTCCPNNTFKAGSCSASLLSCYFDVPNSVYETKFNTVLTTGENNETFDSCIAMATFFKGCQTGQFCPNSPGKCSPFNPVAPEIVSECGGVNSQCNDLSSCVIKDSNTPRISYWSGKVNQHFDLISGTWMTDPDGISGAGIDKLAYCKKFYPETENFVEYKVETINNWKSIGNIGGDVSSRMSYRCILKGETINSKCSYNSATDTCRSKTCQLEKDFSYQLDSKNYSGQLSCRSYLDKVSGKNIYVKQLKVSTSCPSDWTSVGGGYCVNNIPVPCSLCDNGFKCTEDSNDGDDLGVCESNKICKSDAACGLNPNDSSKYACLKTQDKSCDCCCEIGQDSRDCCAPLKCMGTCGSDTTNNGEGYGSCSGCTAAGSTTSLRDAACNCSTTSGKFCDTSKPSGICVDCAALDQAGCSAHSTQCCFDEAKGVCQGGDGTILADGKCAYYDCDINNPLTCNQTPSATGQFLSTTTCSDRCAKGSGTICDSGLDAASCSLQSGCCFDVKSNKCSNGTDKLNILGVNYCSYYNCDSANKTCNSVASTTGAIKGLSNCSKQCKENTSYPGLSCASESIGTCDTSLCGDNYQCLSSSGETPTGIACGTCCCNPGDKIGDLTCLADQGSCTGSSRGLFCGCSSDSQCGADSSGCGSDTCCHGRPFVVDSFPKHEEENVCRNRQIEIIFSEEMNVETLANNILLIEEKEYGVDMCSDGTTVTFDNFKPKKLNFFAKLFYKVTNTLRIMFGGSNTTAIAATPSSDKLYCTNPITIESVVSSYRGATSTKAYLKPVKILAADTNYFVVIKGDEKLDSNSGVMSLNNVGLNNSSGEFISPIYSAQDSANTVFNGVGFYNSYSFSFRTMPDNTGKNGLCTISRVNTTPNSFLIKTSENDKTDDTPGTNNFDKISDSDRAISASAYSSDGQLLQPVTGYSWKWDWKIEDSSVAQKVNISGLNMNQVVVKAVVGVTDKSTKVVATVNMDGYDNATFEGRGVDDYSSVYVFMCTNPWPMEIGGIWNPWIDKCLDNSGNPISGCLNYNYKFYYCRDAGAPGTNDDLPAVTDPALILGSSGNMMCSGSGTSCSKDTDCSNGETCIWNILKESYFFREAVPQAGEIWEIRSTGAGGQVAISWYSPIIKEATTTAFKIYYGLVDGKTSSYVKSLTLTEASCVNNVTKLNCSYLINGLTDGAKYYFKVSALTDKKSESPLSGSKEVTPIDTTAPAVPSWYNDKNLGRIMYWGGKVNQHFDLATGTWMTDPDGSSGAGIDRLTYCKKFYPGTISVEPYKLETISTWKSSGNVGNHTATIMSYHCVINNIRDVVVSDDKLVINWTANKDDALYYRIFHGIFAGKKASDSVDSANNATSVTLNKANYRSGDHFFYLAAIDKSGNISATSEEVKISIK